MGGFPAACAWLFYRSTEINSHCEDFFRLKTSSLVLSSVAAALLFAAVFAANPQAQAPQAASSQPVAAATPSDHDSPHPPPTNLKVLPKNLTGEQVHGIMKGWAAALGVHCDTCHVADPGKFAPNGRPRLNFADDSRPEKSTARLMFKMTEDINGNYISMVDNSGAPVTCGTCHRGHLTPEPFAAPPDAPHSLHAPSSAPPPAGATLP